MDKNEGDLVDLKIALTQLVEATKTNTHNIGTLTNDVKEMTRDLKDTLCAKHECDTLKKDMKYMYSRQDKLDGRVTVIEGVPNALMKRFAMTIVAGVAIYLLFTVGITK